MFPTRNVLRKFASVALVAPVSAFAALPAAVTTSIADAQTDGLTLVGLMLALAAAVFLIYKIAKRLVGG